MEDVVVVELPTNLDRSVTVMYEAGNAIGKHCKYPDLAWEYLKYWSSAAVQSRYNASGIAVSARKDVEEAKVESLTNFVRSQSRAVAIPIQNSNTPASRRDVAFQKVVPSARPPWGAMVEGYDRVEDIAQKAMDAVLKNGAPVQSALTKAAVEIDREFAKR